MHPLHYDSVKCSLIGAVHRPRRAAQWTHRQLSTALSQPAVSLAVAMALFWGRESNERQRGGC